MIKIGLIGVGRWGTNILRTLEGMRDVKVVVNPDSDDIDGVIIATPGSTHAEIALPFIKIGMPTFIEKPMTTNLKDAEQIKKAAKNIVMVGHVHLYNPAFLKAKELIKKKIGKIRLLRFEGRNDGPIRDDMSVLWDWGPHGISMILNALGEAPTHAQAWGYLGLRPGTKLYDAVEARLLFPGNVEGTLAVSWLSPEKRVKLTVIGSKASVIFDDAAVNKVALYRKGEFTHPSYDKQPPLKLELEAFIKAIKTKKQPLTDVNNGLKVVKILAAAEKSIALDGKKILM